MIISGVKTREQKATAAKFFDFGAIYKSSEDSALLTENKLKKNLLSNDVEKKITQEIIKLGVSDFDKNELYYYYSEVPENLIKAIEKQCSDLKTKTDAKSKQKLQDGLWILEIAKQGGSITFVCDGLTKPVTFVSPSQVKSFSTVLGLSENDVESLIASHEIAHKFTYKNNLRRTDDELTAEYVAVQAGNAKSSFYTRLFTLANTPNVQSAPSEMKSDDDHDKLQNIVRIALSSTLKKYMPSQLPDEKIYESVDLFLQNLSKKLLILKKPDNYEPTRHNVVKLFEEVTNDLLPKIIKDKAERPKTKDFINLLINQYQTSLENTINEKLKN